MRTLLFCLGFWCMLGNTFLQAQEAKALQQRWQFDSIVNQDGEALIDIDSSDYMVLAGDSTFRYELVAKDSLLAKGRYSSSNDVLHFHYSLPRDTIRHYRIKTLNDSVLIINEGKVDYRFVRNDEDYQGALPLNYDFQNSEFSMTSILRGLLGLLFLLGLTWLFSARKKHVNWALIFKGLLIQIIFAFAILKVSFIRIAFDKLSEIFVVILSFTEEGAKFLFRGLITDTETFGYIFAFQVLPTVIFFSALTNLLFYYGVMQKVVYAFAWVMKRTMKLSGAESLAAAGNIFIGQTEAPLLVKPYISKMTRSELLCLMSGGMATIAGGVLAAYIGFLGGEDAVQQAFFAKHLLAASVMSAPAAVIAAKIIMPEKEVVNQEMKYDRGNAGSNALEAITKGTTDGLRLAVNVGAMLLVFIAFIAMANYILSDFIGASTGLNELVASSTNGQYEGFTLEFILGYILAPVTWLMGVASEDIILVGHLLGEKTILNEFVAYISLGEMAEAQKFTSEKSIIMATYILCGFSNFASIGIQIGGIGSLAPSRKADLSKMGFQALVAGTMASLFTAVIVGMLI